jgi:hypothetical protein
MGNETIMLIGNLSHAHASQPVSQAWTWIDKVIYLGLVAVMWWLLNFIVNLPAEGEEQ